jgi:hypothetical protein
VHTRISKRKLEAEGSGRRGLPSSALFFGPLYPYPERRVARYYQAHQAQQPNQDAGKSKKVQDVRGEAGSVSWHFAVTVGRICCQVGRTRTSYDLLTGSMASNAGGAERSGRIETGMFHFATIAPLGLGSRVHCLGGSLRCHSTATTLIGLENRTAASRCSSPSLRTHNHVSHILRLSMRRFNWNRPQRSSAMHPGKEKPKQPAHADCFLRPKIRLYALRSLRLDHDHRSGGFTCRTDYRMPPSRTRFFDAPPRRSD